MSIKKLVEQAGARADTVPPIIIELLQHIEERLDKLDGGEPEEEEHEEHEDAPGADENHEEGDSRPKDEAAEDHTGGDKDA